MVEQLDNLFFSQIYYIQILISLIINLVIVFLSYKTKKLDITGSITALFLGMVIFLCLGLKGYLILMFFFVLSAITSKISNKKFKTNKIHEKGSNRDSMQVIANGMIAMLYAIMFKLSFDNVYLVLYSVAIAQSLSDTLSSDIGVLSKTKPISIRTFKKVEKGFSGAISLLGCISGIVGSFLVSILFALLLNLDKSKTIYYIMIIISSSFVGNLFDSFLGSTIQVLYYDREKNEYTEQKIRNNRKLEKIRGASFFDNDMVNLSSNLISCLLAYSLLMIIK